MQILYKIGVLEKIQKITEKQHLTTFKIGLLRSRGEKILNVVGRSWTGRFWGLKN